MSKKRIFRRILVVIIIIVFLTGAGLAAGVYFYLVPKLPSTESLKNIQFQVPLRVYTRDGKLIAEFGEKKRVPVQYQNIPPLMVKALISAEDDRFFEHPGVDYQGLLRASFYLLVTGKKSQGGSTITMQVARNFFLSRKKTYARKLIEILLALKIEHELSKEEILELYLNKIYFGNRAYGVSTAAQVYYGKTLDELTLAQMAMIVGLPKAPSRYNPIADPDRAKLRRNYVLGRMHSLDYINDEALEISLNEPISSKFHGQNIETEAPYIAEMVRKVMVDQYGEGAYSSGYNVFTTIDGKLQTAANYALRKALLEYDQRHGYRGVLEHLDWVANSVPSEWDQALKKHKKIGPLKPALVVSLEDKSANIYLEKGLTFEIKWGNLVWARPYLDDNRVGKKPKSAADILRVGDVVLVMQQEDGSMRLTQEPIVSGALVSLDPNTGSILALVGGFDFFQSKYNRVTQAKRQPGSSFKPFIYSAALEKGYTAASIINDAPVVFEDPALESAWRPENYSGKFFGPTRLREGLVRSRNLISIRLLRAIGVKYTINYAKQFGFNAERLPRNLSLALGSGSVTPLELARAHSALANGGYLITPNFITRIEDSSGITLLQNNPKIVCPKCEEEIAATRENTGTQTFDDDTTDTPGDEDISLEPQVRLAPRIADPRNIYIINSLMRDVVSRGTGRKAMKLGRHDLAGKTGTTNDQQDAWFVGFNQDLIAVSWVGFDDPRPLGRGETGGRAALPAWLYYMEVALKDKPETSLERPAGLDTVRIDPESGLLADSNNPKAIFETFRNEYVPTQRTETQRPGTTNESQSDSKRIPEQLF